MIKDSVKEIETFEFNKKTYNEWIEDGLAKPGTQLGEILEFPEDFFLDMIYLDTPKHSRALAYILQVRITCSRFPEFVTNNKPYNAEILKRLQEAYRLFCEAALDKYHGRLTDSLDKLKLVSIEIQGFIDLIKNTKLKTKTYFKNPENNYFTKYLSEISKIEDEYAEKLSSITQPSRPSVPAGD